MYLKSLFALLASALYANAQANITPEQVLASLSKQPTLSEFAALLRETSQNVLAPALARQRGTLVINVPVNGAPGAIGSLTARELHHRAKSGAQLRMYMDTDYNVRKRTKRGDAYDTEPVCSVPPPFGTIETLLDDPEFVNLGPGRGQNIISKHSTTGKGASIFTGLGTVSNTLDTIYDNDLDILFVPLDRYFTTPILLSESLCKLGANTFLEAIREAGEECELDALTRITVFAPLNPTSDCVDDAVVTDFLGYTTDLTCGTLTAKSGAKIEITESDDGTFYVNGDPIVKSDIVLKNGVVHFVDNSPKHPPSTPEPEPITTECTTEAPEPTTECTTEVPEPTYTPVEPPKYDGGEPPVYTTEPPKIYTPEPSTYTHGKPESTSTYIEPPHYTHDKPTTTYIIPHSSDAYNATYSIKTPTTLTTAAVETYAGVEPVETIASDSAAGHRGVKRGALAGVFVVVGLAMI